MIAQEGSNPEATTTDIEKYRFNHTMIRCKDPEKSLQFYRSVLGMSLLRTMERPEAKFNLYFLGYRQPGYPDHHHTGEGNPFASKEGLVELTWNYGTESDADFKYHNGNAEPQGFGVALLTLFLFGCNDEGISSLKRTILAPLCFS